MQKPYRSLVVPCSLCGEPLDISREVRVEVAKNSATNHFIGFALGHFPGCRAGAEEQVEVVETVGRFELDGQSFIFTEDGSKLTEIEGYTLEDRMAEHYQI